MNKVKCAVHNCPNMGKFYWQDGSPAKICNAHHKKWTSQQQEQGTNSES